MNKEKDMTEQQNTSVSLEEMALQELASRLRGALLRPSDAGYEQARQVYNGMIDKRPALIARCLDVADVIALVNFAREHELTLAVRGGGHSGPGLSTCDDGLVIDLSSMKGIRVDPSARTVRVEGGCTWSEVVVDGDGRSQSCARHGRCNRTRHSHTAKGESRWRILKLDDSPSQIRTPKSQIGLVFRPSGPICNLRFRI